MKIEIDLTRVELEEKLGMQHGGGKMKTEFDWHIKENRLQGVTINISSEPRPTIDQDTANSLALKDALKEKFGLV
jgi:hypothetical protein